MVSLKSSKNKEEEEEEEEKPNCNLCLVLWQRLNSDLDFPRTKDEMFTHATSDATLCWIFLVKFLTKYVIIIHIILYIVCTLYMDKSEWVCDCCLTPT